MTTLSDLSSSSSARRCRMCPWCIVRSSGVKARPLLSAPRATSSSIRASPARLVELGWVDILDHQIPFSSMKRALSRWLTMATSGKASRYAIPPLL